MDDERHIEDLARNLPRSVTVEPDLWPRIAASIDTPVERRIRQLPREIQPTRDLWPEISRGLSACHRRGEMDPASGRQRLSAVGAFGILALVTLATLFSIQVQKLPEAESITAADNPLPTSITELLGRFTGAAPGTPAAELHETALEIQRDLVMTRSQRQRIEQAMAVAVNDINLRAQWRHVYVTELHLINEAQNLGYIHLTRSEI